MVAHLLAAEAGWQLTSSNQLSGFKANKQEIPIRQLYQTPWSSPIYKQPWYSHLMNELGTEHPRGIIFPENSVLYTVRLDKCGKLTVSFTVQAHF